MPDNNLRRALSGIVDDLWGSAPKAEAPAPAQAAEQAGYTSTFPPFEQLWKTADDTVDWTDALTCDRPSDGLTSPQKWALMHRHAAAVLAGDLNAYLEVLRAVHPLEDLGAYAAAFHVETTSSDCLTLHITAAPAYMQGSEDEIRRYLCAVALRAARDLMALLPVSTVCIRTQHEDKTCLSVAFDRGEMQKVRFSFIDPVDFALRCGAVFGEEEA